MSPPQAGWRALFNIVSKTTEEQLRKVRRKKDGRQTEPALLKDGEGNPMEGVWAHRENRMCADAVMRFGKKGRHIVRLRCARIPKGLGGHSYSIPDLSLIHI